MGRKFDAGLPDMNDDELYGVDETSLDVLSLRALHREIAYRERREEEENAPDNDGKGREGWWAEGRRYLPNLVLALRAIIGSPGSRSLSSPSLA